jgi:hypothetical protein
VSGEFPGVEIKPVIGHFDLVAIDNLLLENTISISQTISPGGIVERGQAVEEAGSKSTQATVSESCVMLLFDDVFNPETQVRKALCTKKFVLENRRVS